MTHHFRLGPALTTLCMAVCVLLSAPGWGTARGGTSGGEADEHAIQIETVTPDPRGGRAYRLTYTVPVPMDVYWRFKTDFDNDFLVENRFIRRHRCVSRSGDKVITETYYANAPDVAFLWETTVFEEDYRLTFLLLNPDQCGQRFHYGHIALSEAKRGTRVTQVAYFDFRGASLWVGYPWRGGMRDLLVYTAQWEKNMVVRLEKRYRGTQR